MGKKRIACIVTGETIACVPGPEGMCPAFTEKEMIQLVPELSHIAEIEGNLIMNIDSSNMQPEDWTLIAQNTASALEKCDGAVISHGTDTMAYTSSALTYMLTNLKKPVVVTGSQKSIGEGESDASINLVDSFNVATSEKPGVFVVFGGKIIIGDRASKIKTESFDAFASINVPIVGSIQRRIHSPSMQDGGFSHRNFRDCNSLYFENHSSKKVQEDCIKWDELLLETERARLKKIWGKLWANNGLEISGEITCKGATCSEEVKGKPVILYDRVNPEVLLIKLYPGINPDVLLYAKEKGYHSVLIESFGAGGVPFRDGRNLIPAIEELIASGITVAVTTQVPFEGVNLTRYEVGKKALEAGAISTGDMTRESALVRLMMGCLHQ